MRSADAMALRHVVLQKAPGRMTPDTRDRGAGAVRGVFESSTELITYRYVGCSSVLVDRHHAQGRMSIRRDMRLPGGALLTAPIAIAMLDTAGINIDPYYHAACTHIDVHLWDPGRDVTSSRSSVPFAGRPVQRSSPRHSSSTLRSPNGFWVRGPSVGPSSVPRHPDSPIAIRDRGLPDSADLPTLAAGFGAEEVGDGRFRLGGLSGLVGYRSASPRTDPRHVGGCRDGFGPFARRAPADPWISTASLRLVRAGKNGPFEVTSEPLGGPTSPAVATRMVDQDAGRHRDRNGLVPLRLVGRSVQLRKIRRWKFYGTSP